ncbi:MAG: hypothetical protein JO337_07920 [Acidimicrobiales bacterium]|nr:hypothetical protein [Acidimicrobiales bacterium]
MSRFDLSSEITLTFDEARVVYSALDEAETRAPEGSEPLIRLHACLVLIAHKLFPELGDIS